MSEIAADVERRGAQKVCQSDFVVFGFQEGERALTVVRTLCTLITISILASWRNRWKSDRLMLFFSHWLSGLVLLLAEGALAEIVLLCWGKFELVIVIKTIKIIGMMGGNMLAVTNVAICANLAFIVHRHRTMSRVDSMSSPRPVLVMFVCSLVVTVAAVPFWGHWAMTGTSFYTTVDMAGGQKLVTFSFFMLDLVAGVVMTIIAGIIVLFRRPELYQAWHLHGRIRCYFGLTVIAIAVDLGISVGGILFLFDKASILTVSITWIVRYLHIAVDTLLLYGVLGPDSFGALENDHAPAAVVVSCDGSAATSTRPTVARVGRLKTPSRSYLPSIRIDERVDEGDEERANAGGKTPNNCSTWRRSPPRLTGRQRKCGQGPPNARSGVETEFL